MTVPVTSEQVVELRNALGLTQVQFAQLFDVHFMTVSKWERGVLVPTPYQRALMQQFAQTAAARHAQVQEVVKALLIGAGAIAALVWLLGASHK